MFNSAEMLLVFIVLIPLVGLMTLPAMLMKPVAIKQATSLKK